MPPPSTFWEDNPKLRSLLLVLICVFLLSGLVLVILSQIQQNYRNKIYIETEQSLPKHEIGVSESQKVGVLDTSSWKTYKNDEYGFEFMYPSGWSISTINAGDGYDFSKPYILLFSGGVSDVPCEDYGCLPKSGDRDELTKGNTYEGSPPLVPWYKILRVRGRKWISIQLTDVSKLCSSEDVCQQYIKLIPLEQKLRMRDIGYQNYNNFLDLIDSFKVTK